MKECPECGGAVPNDFEQCPECGAHMGLASGSPAPPVPEESPDSEPGEPAPTPDADAPPSPAPGLICPECGRTSPEGAQYCIYCRYAFGEERKRPAWQKYALVAGGLLAVLLVVVVALLFGGFFGDEVPESPAATAARTGAAALVPPSPVPTNGTVNLKVTPRATNGSVSVRPSPSLRTNNSTPAPVTPAPNGTLSRYIQGAEGSGGGRGGRSPGGHLGSGLYSSVRGGPVTTPVPRSPEYPTPRAGGFGYPVGPLAWEGWGNWSPGYVPLPAGPASVVVESSGTTAVVLADQLGALLGLSVVSPPGGTFSVTVPRDGDYLVGFGAANVSDGWKARIVTATPAVAPGGTVSPALPSPATETLSYAGTSGGVMPAVNLSPGTVSVRLSADQLTMAYLKGSSGTTLSTTVAGPNPGGSTATVSRADQYHLEVWGTGAWSATVTWIGHP